MRGIIHKPYIFKYRTDRLPFLQGRLPQVVRAPDWRAKGTGSKIEPHRTTSLYIIL